MANWMKEITATLLSTYRRHDIYGSVDWQRRKEYDCQVLQVLGTSLGINFRNPPKHTPDYAFMGSPQSYEYIWDGSSLLALTHESERQARDIATWLLADKEMRALPEFGLGNRPESRRKDAPLLLQFTNPHGRLKQIFESQARIMGYLIEMHLDMYDCGRQGVGFGINVVVSHTPKFYSVLLALKKKKLIDCHGTPTYGA